MLGLLPLCLLFAHLGQILHGSDSNCNKKAPSLPALVLSVFLLGTSMSERGQSSQAGRCQCRLKGIFSHTAVCFVNVDVLFSCLCYILSFHAEIRMGLKLPTWCWDLPQTCYIQLLICPSLEGNGAPVFFYLSCFWELLFGNSWRTWLVLEAKIPMPLCAFSCRLSFLMNWTLIEVSVLTDDIADSPLWFLLLAAVWVDGSEAYWD